MGGAHGKPNHVHWQGVLRVKASLDTECRRCMKRIVQGREQQWGGMTDKGAKVERGQRGPKVPRRKDEGNG